jgi:hypothetical protein
MPVEILEIVVRANIHEPGATPAATPELQNGEEDNFKRQQLIEEAVEQMLEVLRRREER